MANQNNSWMIVFQPFLHFYIYPWQKPYHRPLRPRFGKNGYTRNGRIYPKWNMLQIQNWLDRPNNTHGGNNKPSRHHPLIVHDFHRDFQKMIYYGVAMQDYISQITDQRQILEIWGQVISSSHLVYLHTTDASGLHAKMEATTITTIKANRFFFWKPTHSRYFISGKINYIRPHQSKLMAFTNGQIRLTFRAGMSHYYGFSTVTMTTLDTATHCQIEIPPTLYLRLRRVHTRFKNQIEGQKGPILLIDFSLGGVLLQFPENAKFTEGQFIKLNVSIPVDTGQSPNNNIQNLWLVQVRRLQLTSNGVEMAAAFINMAESQLSQLQKYIVNLQKADSILKETGKYPPNQLGPIIVNGLLP